MSFRHWSSKLERKQCMDRFRYLTNNLTTDVSLNDDFFLDDIGTLFNFYHTSDDVMSTSSNSDSSLSSMSIMTNSSISGTIDSISIYDDYLSIDDDISDDEDDDDMSVCLFNDESSDIILFEIDNECAELFKVEFERL